MSESTPRWIFDTSANTITDGAQTWNARSGPHGRGELEAGRYTIGNATHLNNVASNRSYRDPSNNVWWVNIEPTFSTTRSSLGVHPDGGTAGTEGCIGATDQNTLTLYEALRTSNGEILLVR